ncbi:MAG: hypothetical protein HYS21_03490 [Deltaproteobacteria bacterium]|nr:hypothetical protein [Deltaproteobacteria bacterium]
MEKSKIELFKKENPSKEFPTFRQVHLEEQKALFQKMSEKLGLELQEDLFTIAKTIIQKAIPIEGFNAQNVNFNLFQLLSNLEIKPEKNVFVNWWFKYGDVDEFAFTDLNDYFNDIWFPGPDDLDIFDSTFNWIIHIDHSGFISLIE